MEDEPWHLQPSPEVTLRASKISNDSLEPGRLLNSAIARHFRNLHCQGGPEPGKFPLSTSARVLSTKLSLYMREVFTQLDSLHQGWISREDFDALCEILGVSSQPVGRRTSGLEWLPSYQPRPHTPGSPLRMDRLGEVRYHPPRPNPPKDPPSFLWTIGPRPFWEMWPARRNRRKNLSLQEFTESLLEQWAVTHGYPVEEARKMLQSKTLVYPPEEPPPKETQPLLSASNRLERGVERMSRRRQLLERLSRRRPPSPLSHPQGNGFHVGNGINGGGGGQGANGVRNGGPPAQTNGTSKLSGFFRGQRKEQLEQRLASQQTEITSLKSVIEELRGSLQLSDAQNLALQVVLKRMAKAESQLPVVEKAQYRSKIQKSEKQLENLISELKEMSQTKYPTLSSQNYSTSSSSYTAQGSVEPELGPTQEYLSGVQKELRGIASKLRQSPSAASKDLSLTEAFDALVEAQIEIQKMRSNLEKAQAALEATQTNLSLKESELREARLSMTDTSTRLNESERNISQLRENRKSLLQELKAAKEVLISSLRNVHDLEVESQKVPKLEAKIHQLETSICRGRTEQAFGRQNLESIMFSVSDSDPEDSSSKQLNQSIEGGSDDDLLFSGREAPSGLPPPRPLSGRSPRCPGSPPGDPSCRTTTPSSGHFSSASKVSSPSPGQEGAVPRLRRELDSLRRRHSQEQRDWTEERHGLVAELARCRHGSQDDFARERQQISMIEEKIREVLAMLRSLNTMNISDSALGKMVVEAVEAAYDPVVGEVAVFRFLALLYQSTRDYERNTAEDLLNKALRAVGDDTVETSDSSSSSLGVAMPEGMRTLRPRRPQDHLRPSEPAQDRLNKEDAFQIHV